MSLKDTLTEDLKDALRAGDEPRKTVVRMILASIKNAEVPTTIEHIVAPGDTWETIAAKYGVDAEQLAATYSTNASEPVSTTYEPSWSMSIPQPTRPLDDDGIRAVIAKQVKQHRDSIDAFQNAGRQDLVDREAAELKVLEAYLPAQMSPDDIAAEARAVIAEVGASGPGDKGKVMSALMPRLAGRAEGRAVNEAVTKLLSS